VQAVKTIHELNEHDYPTTPEINSNLEILFDRLMECQAAYVSDGGKPFVITSGLRSDAKQRALIKQGKTAATKSKHLIGCAADVYDPDRKLAAWVQKNLLLMEIIGLWMESFEHTRGWVHFQTRPPKSGRRVFLP